MKNRKQPNMKTTDTMISGTRNLSDPLLLIFCIDEAIGILILLLYHGGRLNTFSLGKHSTAHRSAERIIAGIDDSLSLHPQIIPDKQFASCREELNTDILYSKLRLRTSEVRT
ncbi:hypothetical protein D5086_012621 [Populus alba]|uniref:Uncharacterized protein n=1 Tax=Populus alba TaxID=43335 RepID=A0ACC4C2N7_POPAL